MIEKGIQSCDYYIKNVKCNSKLCEMGAGNV